MKKCAHCGAENAEDAVKCQACGTAAFFDPIAPPITTSATERRDRDHLNLLSIFHFLGAAMCICGIGAVILHHRLMKMVFTKAMTGKHPFPVPPEDLMRLMNWGYRVAGVFLIIGFILNLLSGFCLWQRKHRIFSLVVAGINCVQVPIGTLLGVFTIIVLSRTSVREVYNKSYSPRPDNHV